MRIVVFGPDRRVGAMLDGFVVDLAHAAEAYGTASGAALPAGLRSFIEAGPRAVADAERLLVTVRAALAGGLPGIAHAAATVQLHAPHVEGARVACVSGNFADHTAAIDAKRANDPNFQPDMPKITREIRERGIVGFWKVAREAAGPDGDVFHPARTRCFDFESELAIVIGKRARNVGETELHDYVWGVTLFGDWSARQGIKGAQQFTLLKNFDTSFSVGPWIVVGEDVDPSDVQIETYVNGERRQNYNTSAMIFTFAESLAFITRDLTLHPGDLIAGGTAAGTCGESAIVLPEGGFSPEGFLVPGDVVEIRSPAVGVLRNRIVAALP
jgi:acylpyruvate hydrolase